jgi:two-component system, NarL family, nitrate/nitrite response regulator NarL
VNTAASRSLVTGVAAHPGIAGTLEALPSQSETMATAYTRKAGESVRVYVSAENRLLREALSRMLAKHPSIEIVGLHSPAPMLLDREPLQEAAADVLLHISQGCVEEDLVAIQLTRARLPKVRILLIGMTKDHGEFLRCVRAGISGYMLPEASADEVVEGIRAVQDGKAVCPGVLCTALFRYFEAETSGLPCASLQQRLGLTRREQQLIPLIAKGLTNKEIANHFCLSEQTVKNHLYRMKHKIGAGDRLGIVQTCRTQGFLL